MRVVGLRQHSTNLQHAHSDLLQYAVVQQLWAGNSVRHVATVRLQHSASAMGRLPGTATVTNDVTARRHTNNRVQQDRQQDRVFSCR
jgi:hypothetical protein